MNCLPSIYNTYSDRANNVKTSIMENYNDLIHKIGLDELEYYRENGSAILYTGEFANNLKKQFKRLNENNLDLIIEMIKDAFTDFERSIMESSLINISSLNAPDKNICRVHYTLDESEIRNIVDTTKKYINENTIDNIVNLSENDIISYFNKCFNEKTKDIITVDKKLLERSDTYFSTTINDINISEIVNSIEEFYDIITEDINDNNYIIDNIDESAIDNISNISKSMCIVECAMVSCIAKLLDYNNRIYNEYVNIAIKSNSVSLNEISIIKSRRQKLAYKKKKLLGNDINNNIKLNKEQIKSNEKKAALKARLHH